MLLRNVGRGTVHWYLKLCSEKTRKGLEDEILSWLPELSEKEKRHLDRILCDLVDSAHAPTDINWALTSKVRVLLNFLRVEAGPSFTGIVFAEQRCAVAALAEVIATHPSTAGLFNIGTVVGSTATSKQHTRLGDVVELANQQKSLEDFREGKKNLIIATSVLEEGIDVSTCGTILCFDAPMNLISFVQRRGRARKRGSKYIILMEENDTKGGTTIWRDLEDRMKAAYMEGLRDAQLAAALESEVQDFDRQYLVPHTGYVNLTYDKSDITLYMLTLVMPQSSLDHFKCQSTSPSLLCNTVDQ